MEASSNGELSLSQRGTPTTAMAFQARFGRPFLGWLGNQRETTCSDRSTADLPARVWRRE